MPPTKPPPAPQNPIHVRVAKDIGKRGWMAIGVFPTANDPIDPFTYSVGLYRTYDHPELAITGMGAENAHGVMSILVDRIKDGFRFEPQVYPDLLPGRDHNFTADFRQVTEKHRQESMRMAWRWNAYEDYPALQVVWPDAAGEFPWDPKYERRMIQPLWSLA